MDKEKTIVQLIRTVKKMSGIAMLFFFFFLGLHSKAQEIESKSQTDSSDYIKRALPLIAQLVGDVRDSTENYLLGDAIVILKDSNGKVLERVSTDDREKFDLSIETNQTYILEVMHYLYHTRSFFVDPQILDHDDGIIGFPVLLSKKPVWGIVGTIYAKETLRSLSGVKVVVIDTKKGSRKETVTNYLGNFRLLLDQNSDYEISLLREEYFPVYIKFSTKNRDFGQVTLNEIVNLQLTKIEVNKSIEIPDIYYKPGEWVLSKEAKSELAKLALLLKDNPSVKIELGSHTDSKGDAISNEVLSQKRAEYAKQYLLEEGISEERILAKGYGESALKNQCNNEADCTDEQHQENRRTEVLVLER